MKQELFHKQLERMRHLVEVLVTLIPEGFKPDDKLKASVEKHFRTLKEESKDDWDEKLYSYAEKFIQSRLKPKN